MKIMWSSSIMIYLLGIYIIVLSILIVDINVVSKVSAKSVCGPGKKPDPHNPASCIGISTLDVMNAISELTNPPSIEPGSCAKVTTIQGISICEDDLSHPTCQIVSIIMTEKCGDTGSLEFEQYWGSRCKVNLFHMSSYMSGCNHTKNKVLNLNNNPNISFATTLMWQGGCFSCVYKLINSNMLPIDNNLPIDVLKVQRISLSARREDIFDGTQYTVLSDLYLHMPSWMDRVNQVVFTASISSTAMVDSVGREAEHGWNMWATSQLLFASSTFASFHTIKEVAPFDLRPLQLDYLLTQIPHLKDLSVCYYHHSLRRVSASNSNQQQQQQHKNENKKNSLIPIPHITGTIPGYCSSPAQDSLEYAQMQQWIDQEINSRCQPYALWIKCDYSRTYDAFVPCKQDLADYLAEDYAAMKGWCDYNHTIAQIPSLENIDPKAQLAFQRPALQQQPKLRKKIRIAFLFTIYSDAKHVKKLLSLLYSSDHYYLLHIDPVGSSSDFEQEIRQEIATNYLYNTHNNIFITKDVQIVYGASTASLLLTKAMAWFLRRTSGWDYFVSVTGSDYPLLPLHRFEDILATQQPPMPFVMAWTAGTNTHMFRLAKTHPIFDTDPQLKQSIEAIVPERAGKGGLLGLNPMESRSNNFGPPLLCNKQQSFYRLDNRFNKSGSRFDTQWLFPRNAKGRAYVGRFIEHAKPSFDGVWRVWKKSDPATTAAYDRESVEYIVESEEGRKYYHFFKHMLLGSEEHYQVSLLYNWDRTRSFVQTLSAEMVWNTWLLGLWEHSHGFQTHTHFLSTKEFDLLKGFSKRGMMFARKFNSKKNQDLIDMIDTYVHNNASTDAGAYWPGYYYTDIWTLPKEWGASFRRNESIRLAELKKQQQQPQQQQQQQQAFNGQQQQAMKRKQRQG